MPIFRRINLVMMIFSMLFIFFINSNFQAFVLSSKVLKFFFIYIPVVWMTIDIGHQISKQLLISSWFKQSLLLLWSFLTIVYGLLYSRDTVSTGYYTNFYAMILVRSVFFYLYQMNPEQLRNYIGILLQKPAHVTVLSYLVLILFFSVLLLLPISQIHYSKGELNSLNALFVTVSAFCVTGLTPIDISQTFNLFGLGILLLAVQLGGIGIALLGSIMLYVKRSVGLSGRTLLAYSFSDDAVSDVGKVALRVIFTTFIIELLGAFYLTVYFLQSDYHIAKAVGYGLFFSISAFCNAGFSLFPNGLLEPVRFDLSFLWVINLLIVLGVLGFNFLFYEITRLKHSFYRAFKTWYTRGQKIEHNSAINGTLVLWSGYGSLAMMVVVFFLYYAFEHRFSLYDLTIGQQYIESFFLAVDAKTAGFMSRDYSTLRLSSKMVFLIAMFIGGSSGGTAGGIKINTILVIFAGIKAFINRRPLAKIGNFSISWEDVRKANILFISAIFVSIGAVFLLSITEQEQNPLFIFWEVISALGTVGTSLNYTAELTSVGQLIIMVVMIIGRMGALTLFNVAQERVIKKEPTYPMGNIYIG